ncbi:NADH dehydrogenase subunit 3 (mitochondrion) [Mya arenaria]|uniref:NADH-ubiquinone oxidoreductase chain 3 n=1 Tax=Mya arenaria TaxID=6604 RepID=A0A076JE81_MYAAR|nr:NADH dehydrogenase subunit 3 [Mya arenaria]AII72403.1 NADH dehydrogenase subunit 3 [Mya arenaria]UJM44281.1 NADH dehydrogenase subunit 3 [Mya arenaria]
MSGWMLLNENYSNLFNSCQDLSVVGVCIFLGLVGVGLLGLGLLVGKTSRVSEGKKVAFECGFDKMSGARVPFSLQFYHLGLLFLIFDLELVLFMPLVVGMSISLSSGEGISMLFFGVGFIFILLLGLSHEYREGTLSWKK